MPEKNSHEPLTLEAVNSNLTKKLNKIINLLEKSDRSPRINALSDSYTESLIKKNLMLRDFSEISQFQNPLSSLEDKK